MNESHDFDLDQMMERIRSDVHSRRQQVDAVTVPSNQRPMGDYHEQLRDLTTLHGAYEISGSPTKLNRGVLGRVMKGAVSLLNQLLWPTFRRQSEYNAANTRLTDFLKRQGDWLVSDYVKFRDLTERALAGERTQFKAQFEAAHQRFAKLYSDDNAMRSQALAELAQRIAAGEQLQAQLRQELDSCAGAMRELTQRVETLAQQNQLLEQHQSRQDTLDRRQSQFIQTLEAMRLDLEAMGQRHAKNESDNHNRDEEFRTMRMRVLRNERRLRRIGMVENGNTAAALPEPSAPPTALAEIDYAGFEDLLRNSETIKNKQRGYLGYFTSSGPVIDVGCGRGEFLELMREAGIEARGLDLDFDMTLLCKEKGLDVVHCDALAYLAGVADHSLGGIFSAQVIEHLTSAQLNALVALAARKLKPGASLVLETLNPESLFVHYKWFWMDPSHVRLVHPQTLQFLLESAGFAEVCCRLFSPPVGVLPIPQLQGSGIGPLDDFNRATDYLNKLVYGDQEYFVAGRK